MKISLADYQARRSEPRIVTPRPTCVRCRKAVSTCYCELLRPFVAPVPFVILQHLAEARNSIATARMAHLSIRNSTLIPGNQFEHDPQVNALLADRQRRNVLLFPRPGAISLETLLAREAASLDAGQLTVWVLDAKWSQVPKMLRLSPNVKALEAVAFDPDRTSMFSSIRSQPDRHCLSTLEAMFVVIDRIKRQRGDLGREHHALIDVFHHLVRQQLEFVKLDSRRHGAAKALRLLRRQAKLAAG